MIFFPYFQVSVIHIVIIVLTVLAVTARTNTQTIYSGFISLAVGCLFILKMIYQIEYIRQKRYDVNCTVKLLIAQSTSHDVFNDS